MQTRPITINDLSNSVIAVPPLARNAKLKFCPEENRKIVRHIERGNVSTLLYGGNANFYHIALSEYQEILSGLVEIAAEDTLVIPAVGPAYGTMMDQIKILKDFEFPTVMILPQQGLTTSEGVEKGIRDFAEKLGKPIVLYIKYENYIDVEGAARLVNDGLVSWIKYAIVREDPGEDPYLSELVQKVNPHLIVSGIGEQPVIEHLHDFGLTGFTAGCVCIRPELSDELLKMVQAGKMDIAKDIQKIFQPLEDLRNRINPVRVLHEAVALAGIAETGPHLPLLSSLTDSEKAEVKEAAVELLSP